MVSFEFFFSVASCFVVIVLVFVADWLPWKKREEERGCADHEGECRGEGARARVQGLGNLKNFWRGKRKKEKKKTLTSSWCKAQAQVQAQVQFSHSERQQAAMGSQGAARREEGGKNKQKLVPFLQRKKGNLFPC